jgi:hypothetical protein
MQADYAALIEKHHLDGLRMIRNAGDHAKHLLQVARRTPPTPTWSWVWRIT